LTDGSIWLFTNCFWIPLFIQSMASLLEELASLWSQLMKSQRHLMRSSKRLLAGAVGGGIEDIFGPASILHGGLHVLNHRVGVRGR
jgi:hypothetical protein